MEEEKIKKGQALLTMKINAEKHLHLRDPDLMKIPLEALHKVALQQIGEQEAYIEELEAKIRDLEKKCRETANENIKYIMENERLKARIAELEQALTEK